MPVAIVTGFQPFRDHAINPTQQLAEKVADCHIGGFDVVSRVLPVEYGRDTEILLPLIEELRPALVLSLGLAAQATYLWLERLAVNLHSREPGRQERIVADGPAAYWATIDVDAIGQALRVQGIPAQPHVYAGDYLCNHIFYRALHYCAVRGLATKVGFVHVPSSVDQAIAENRLASPMLPLELMLRGVVAAIEACG